MNESSVLADLPASDEQVNDLRGSFQEALFCMLLQLLSVSGEPCSKLVGISTNKGLAYFPLGLSPHHAIQENMNNTMVKSRLKIARVV